MKEYTATMAYMTVLLPFILTDVLLIAGLIFDDYYTALIAMLIALVPIAAVLIGFYRKKGTKKVRYGEDRDPNKVYEDSWAVNIPMCAAIMLITIFCMSIYVINDIRTVSAILLAISAVISVACYFVIRRKLIRSETS